VTQSNKSYPREWRAVPANSKLGTRRFPGTAANQTSFTGNANQSNECTRSGQGSLRVSQGEN